MPLSEHEEELLAQMEEAMRAEDPKFSSTLAGTGSATSFLVAILLVLLGFATLLAGLVAKSTPVGLVGFAIALTGAYLALRRASIKTEAKSRPSFRRSLRDRMNERWDQQQ